jgi:hypothetical protein
MACKRKFKKHGVGALPKANDIASLLIVAAAFVFNGWAMLRLKRVRASSAKG